MSIGTWEKKVWTEVFRPLLKKELRPKLYDWGQGEIKKKKKKSIVFYVWWLERMT